jgi:serine/threonine protein kinase
LTQVDRPLSILDDGIELEAVQIPKRDIEKLMSNTEDESLSHYLIEKVIGKGGFSKVLLVRNKITGILYAMKVMRKDKIKKDNKVN